MKLILLIIFLLLIPIGYSSIIGKGGTEIIWTITKTGNEESLEVEYDILNDSSTEFCIDFIDKTKYENDLSLSNHDIKQVPLTKTKVTLTLDSNIDLSKPRCFKVYYKELVENMSFKIGWDSVIIDTESVLLGMQRSIQQNIVRASNGNLFVAYEGADNDVWFANSSDEGDTWSIKDVFDGTRLAFVGIVINSTGGLMIFFENGTAGADEIKGIFSSDNGTTWSDNITLASGLGTDMARASCTSDSKSSNISWLILSPSLIRTSPVMRCMMASGASSPRSNAPSFSWNCMRRSVSFSLNSL